LPPTPNLDSRSHCHIPHSKIPSLLPPPPYYNHTIAIIITTANNNDNIINNNKINNTNKETRREELMATETLERHSKSKRELLVRMQRQRQINNDKSKGNRTTEMNNEEDKENFGGPKMELNDGEEEEIEANSGGLEA
ncbi:hypothetical protein PIB30_062589, partial [Stylosanthes scabra]|nr:hypothetical protein [Stylosanthes scabra]